MAKARAFISFAAEDAWARDLFVGQGKHPDTPWEIADWSKHEPFTDRWKTQMRERIKQCHAVIQIVSKNTPKAEGAVWEVNCAGRRVSRHSAYGSPSLTGASSPRASLSATSSFGPGTASPA